MANILLINYPGYPRYLSCLMPDNGLASLAAILQSDNHTVTILDYSNVEYIERVTTPLNGHISECNLRSDYVKVKNLQLINNLFIRSLKRVELLILKELCNLIKNKRFDVVGFKLWWGRGSLVSIEWAKKIKETFPDRLIICGGPQATIFREQMFKSLEMEHIDAMFLGEAEHTLSEYLTMYEKGTVSSYASDSVITASDRSSKRPCNLSMRDREALPFPVYDLSVYPSLASNNKLHIYLLDESIGCPKQCGFCNRSWMHPGRRIRSAKSIWQQVKDLNNRYNAKLFKFSGANTPSSIFKSLLQTYPDSSNDYEFMCFGEFESYTSDTISYAHQLGVSSIFFGLETASSSLLQRSYGKKFDASKALEIIRACTAAGIYTAVSIIYPGPWETKKTRKETIEWLRKANPTSVVVQIPSVLYGTKWFNCYKKYNFKLNYLNPIHALLNQDYHDSLYLPLIFGKEPPFLVNGWSYRRISAEFALFAEEIQEMFPACTEEYLLCAEHAGYLGKQGEFVDLIRRSLYGGDVDTFRSMILKINSNILSKPVSENRMKGI